MKNKMPQSKILLSKIQRLDSQAIESLTDELSQQGFAILNTEGYTEASIIKRTLQESRLMKTFRFPSHSETIQYSEDQRICFRTLFQWGRWCLRALLIQMDPDGHRSGDMIELLQQSNAMFNLFPPNGTGHSPFPDGTPFSGSFFNIFHYNYGLLNHHRDRYLVTVVAADVNSDTTKKTALWVNSPTQGWVNLDDRLKPGDIAIFTGEDFQDLSSRLGNTIVAVEHCTRVDPTTDRIRIVDNQPDPSTTETGNRVSIAFVLSESVDT